MRGMNLPKLTVPANSLEQCVKLYLDRLSTDDFLQPDVSLLLTAYMAWPNVAAERDSYVATTRQDLSVSLQRQLPMTHQRLRSRFRRDSLYLKDLAA
jgi:hypothetical protein